MGMQTFTNKMFYPFSPKPEDIDIEDIAHSLSNQCRFNGHSKKFYSVAEHSVYIAENLPKEHALEGLLDDASEAYLGDIIRPVKGGIPEFQKVETLLASVIRLKFGLPVKRSKIVAQMDNNILYIESLQVMGGQLEPGNLPKPDFELEINFWTPHKAKQVFLDKFEEYSNV